MPPETEIPTTQPEFAIRFRCPCCGRTVDAVTRDEIQFLVTAWPECCDEVMMPSVQKPAEKAASEPASALTHNP